MAAEHGKSYRMPGQKKTIAALHARNERLTCQDETTDGIEGGKISSLTLC